MIEPYLIHQDEPVREALKKLNELGPDNILFVVDATNKLLGSLTDGDLRRGFLRGLDFTHSLMEFVQANPFHIRDNAIDVREIKEYRNRNLKLVPVVNDEKIIVSIVNLRLQYALLPVDAVIMAGGEGQRLRPLTEHTPKPLLKIGDKPIIEHNIDRLIKYGISNIYISIRYLGDQLISYFGDGSSKKINIGYVTEDKPLGTLGALATVPSFKHEEILVMNSDLLTNIDFEDFYNWFKEANADFAVATIPYQVKVPYAVLKLQESEVISFEEKPTYTYYSNAGIYLFKKSCIDMIPRDSVYNATDLIESLIAAGKKVISYPILGYWLDIGKPEDFLKAQADIKHLNL